MTSQRAHITLRELQLQIKAAVEGVLPLPVWVVAEVAELKVNYSGHCYLELVEKAESKRGGSSTGLQATAGGSRTASSRRNTNRKHQRHRIIYGIFCFLPDT